MAVQKHNTYYDDELYYYDENGVRKPLQVGKIYSAGSGIKIENDVISVSGKYVSSASTALDGKRLVLVIMNGLNLLYHLGVIGVKQFKKLVLMLTTLLLLGLIHKVI